MSFLEEFLSLLEANGYASTNPRPRLSPKVEKALKDELVEEVTHGEKEPTPVAELPRNVRLLTNGDRQFVLYILESALDVGFWGVNVIVLDELQQQPLPWAVVLLHGKADCGYWLNSSVVRDSVAARWQPIVPNGANYEVRAPADLTEATRFVTAEHLLGLVESVE